MRPGYHRPGRKVLTLLHALLAGGDYIDDADVLGTGSTAAVLGHQVMAPRPRGDVPALVTFGHIRQLERAAETMMARAWAAGAGPGDGPVRIDLDSTICEFTTTTRAARPTATPDSSATTPGLLGPVGAVGVAAVGAAGELAGQPVTAVGPADDHPRSAGGWGT